MTVTPAWIPISSAVAALLGGGFGAMLQGRYGVSNWRRQTRLEAYTHFVNATHDFNLRLFEALDAFGKPDFNEKWGKVREAERSIGRAGSLVSIAGPPSVVSMASRVAKDTRALLDDGKHPDILSSIAQDREAGRTYKKNVAWIESCSSFADISRKVLRTHKSGRPFREKID